MNKQYFKLIVMILAAVVFASVSARTSPAAVQQVSGEIGWVDVQLGQLELNKETSAGTKTTAYRITPHETRVTDPADETFLSVDDLRPGQYVTIEVPDGQKENIISKVIVNPVIGSEFQQTFGAITSVDAVAGTFVVEERVRIAQTEKTRLAYFVFNPAEIVVMRSPDKQPVGLVLKPGDVVRVEFVTLDGKQYARYVTLYSPVSANTITITTTTVTTQ